MLTTQGNKAPVISKKETARNLMEQLLDVVSELSNEDVEELITHLEEIPLKEKK